MYATVVCSFAAGVVTLTTREQKLRASSFQPAVRSEIVSQSILLVGNSRHSQSIYPNAFRTATHFLKKGRSARFYHIIAVFTKHCKPHYRKGLALFRRMRANAHWFPGADWKQVVTSRPKHKRKPFHRLSDPRHARISNAQTNASKRRVTQT